MKIKRMKAIVYTQYGPPDVLKLLDVEKPAPKANEVLVKVHTATVNRTDCGYLRAKPFVVRFFSGLLGPRNSIPGTEFAGDIEAAGKDVQLFKIGDRVFGYSDPHLGAHAEYLVMPEGGMIATIPQNMTYEEVAPSTEGAHYALNNIRQANIQKDQRILVYGATGAIGTAAVQIAKYYGAFVTAVCNTPNVSLVKSLGADRVIDYTQEDFTKSGGEYDLVFDAVGKSSFGACKELLKPKGIYCSTELGFLNQNIYLALWTSIFGGKKVIFPIPKENKEIILFIRELLEKKAFKPVIDRYYPFERIAEAYRYVESGQKIGNVLMQIAT